MPDYESLLERYYRFLLRSGDSAVDIGAHVGRHTAPIAEAVGPAGKVIAAEPLPEMARQLRSFAAPNVEVVELACGARPLDRAAFTYVPDFPGFSGFRERVYPAKATVKICQVEVTTLDALAQRLPRKPRYVKIDVEGAEYLVLLGGKDTLSAGRPIVSIESGAESLRDYEHTAADIFDFFELLNYVVMDIEGVRLTRKDFVVSNEIQRVWDYIAVPREEQELAEESALFLSQGRLALEPVHR
jgi:FkbM family methyltransferase